MAKNARGKSPTKKGWAETETAVPLDEPPIYPMIPLWTPGSQEYEGWVSVGPEGERVITEALARSHGMEAITRHLAAIDLPALVGPSALRDEFYVRPQDLELIADALTDNRGPDVVTLLLAQAVVHAVVHERVGSLRIRSHFAGHSFKRLRGKYQEGPKTRRRKKERRRELIRELLDAGVDVKKIARVLKEDHDIDVNPKTVRNDISAIRKR
jgi:hypothetical protein